MITAQRVILSFALVVSSILSISVSSQAQTNRRGSINGVVLDLTGKAVAGANLTIVNSTIGYNRAATTASTEALACHSIPRMARSRRLAMVAGGGGAAPPYFRRNAAEMFRGIVGISECARREQSQAALG